MKHIGERDRLRAEVLRVEKREQQIASSYNSLKKIKERLEMRVASEVPTALTIINSYKHLEGRGKEEILEGACEMLKALVAPEKLSIYLLEEGVLALEALRGWKEQDNFHMTFSPETSLYKEVIERKRIVLILSGNDAEILQEQGVAAVPILDTGTNHVYGMIKIEEMPFMRLRMASIESLRLIGDWLAQSYAEYLKRENLNK